MDVDAANAVNGAAYYTGQSIHRAVVRIYPTALFIITQHAKSLFRTHSCDQIVVHTNFVSILSPCPYLLLIRNRVHESVVIASKYFY